MKRDKMKKVEKTKPNNNSDETGTRLRSKLKPLLGCHICGGKLVEIRGKYPGDKQREVCPTCLQERMDQINEISQRDYGVAYQEKAI